MGKYRPPGWAAIVKGICERKGGYLNPDTPIYIQSDLDIAEAVADALVGALWELGYRSEIHTLLLDSHRKELGAAFPTIIQTAKQGRWVFIPDDE